MDNYVEISTEHLQPVQAGETMYQNRGAVAALQPEDAPEVTLLVQAYNRPQRIKRCIESILDCTKGIDFELVLLDNGSTDGETLDYFRSVPYDKKRIVHVTKNLGSVFPYLTISPYELGRFVCTMSDDLVLTPRWLENLLACIKSDEKIGMVNAMTTYIRFYQAIDYEFTTYEEVRRFGDEFNRSDPRKWEDRLVLTTLGTLYRKEALLATGWPLQDPAFLHDNADVDISATIRHAGYRVISAGDTWIYHDHPDALTARASSPNKYFSKRSFDDYIEKHLEINVDGDNQNYYIPYLKELPKPSGGKSVRVIGVDVHSGQPLLDVKNRLRGYGIFDVELSAVTKEPRYWADLKTICDGYVCCGYIEDSLSEFEAGSFDYVISDVPFNQQRDPEKALFALFSLCKPDGYVLCKLRNTGTFRLYANLLGQSDYYDTRHSWSIAPEYAEKMLRMYGAVLSETPIYFRMKNARRALLREMRPRGLAADALEAVYEDAMEREDILFEKDRRTLRKMLFAEPDGEQWNRAAEKMITKDYLFLVKKTKRTESDYTRAKRMGMGKELSVLHIAAHMGAGAGKAISGIARLSADEGCVGRILLLEEPKKTNHIDRCREEGIEILPREAARDAIENADVVVLNWWGSRTMDDFLREFPDVPCRVMLWSHKNGFYDPPLSEEIVNACDRLLVTTPLSKTNPDWQDARLVYGFGDFDPLHADVKKEYTLTPGEFRIGYVGLPDYKRFPDDAVEYFKAVLEYVPEARFILAGECSEQVRKDLSDAGLAERVELLGWVDDIPGLLKSFDVLGYLLRSDTYATTENSVLEAMAAAVPVAMPKEPIGKYILGEDHGLFFDSPQSYAEVMRRLYESEQLRRSTGRAERERVLMTCDAEENARRFREECVQAMNEPKRIRKFTV